MPIIGKLIKSAIDLSSEFVSDENPQSAQKQVLKSLLKKASKTAFGKYYQFEKILDQEDMEADFRRNVPLFGYDKMLDQWWKQTLNGVEDISWPGKVKYFAVSSGTTGHQSKKIPVTDDMIKSIRDAGIRQILSLAEFELPENFFEKQILMLGSSTDLKSVDGHYEGEISGISAQNIPDWFMGFYKPGYEIASISEWDKRVEEIAKAAPDWDIGAISGIPTWIELMLKKVIEYHKLNHIHEIWPNLQVFTSGGVAFGPYRKAFNKLLAHPLIYLDTYLASEGFVALQTRPHDEMAMQLTFNSGIYFEFIPFEEQYFNEIGQPKTDAPAIGIGEVKQGEEYALIISTVSGAWRYLIGDTVRIVDKERAEIVITGRTKHFLNVAGSQLSVNKMNEGVEYLEEKSGASFPEFTVAAEKTEDGFYHRWYLGTEDEIEFSQEQLAEFLDKKLQEVNKAYRVARGKALQGLTVSVLPIDVFYRYNQEKKKKGGQVKMPRLLKDEDWEQWKELLEKENT